MRRVSAIGNEFPVEGGELDLDGIAASVIGKARFIGACTLVALLGSVAFVTFATPKYTADAKVLIENQESYFTRPDRESSDPASQAPDAEAIASQVQLFTSRDLGRQAVRQLDLKGNSEFDPLATGPSLVTRFLIMVGLRQPDTPEVREDKILETYFDHLYVFPITKSRVVQVEFSSWDPELAARAANVIGNLYISFQADAKRTIAHNAATSLATLINDLRSKVAAADTRAEAYRAANGLIIGANSLNMAGQQLSDLSTQLTAARGVKADALAKSQMIRSMLRDGRISEIPDVANNELIRRLSEQRVTLRSQLALESRTLLPSHPRIKELSAQLASLEEDFRAAAEKAARTLENDAKIAGSRVENIEAALNDTKKTVSGSSGEEAKARELDREAKILREQLEAATAKYQDALARETAASTPGDARVISRATAPQLPSFPKKIPIIVFSVVAAIFLSVGGVLSAELLSGRAYVRRGPAGFRDAEGTVSSITPGTEPPPTGPPAGRPTVSDFIAARNDAYVYERALEEAAARASAAGGTFQATRILITAGDSVVDPAAVALSLGRAVARHRRAILVDLGTDPDAEKTPVGLSDLMSGNVSFEEVIHRDRGSRLHLLPSGHKLSVTQEAFWPILTALSHTYDQVLLVTPLASREDFCLALAKECDFAVLACAKNHSGDEQSVAQERLRNAGAPEVLVLMSDETSDQPNREVA